MRLSPRHPAVMALWLASAALAAESPRPVSIALQGIPVSNVSLGPLLVELGDTTLPDLVETVGSGAMRRNGRHAHDGGGDEVCFSYRGGVIRFTSNSEMGGSRRSVTDVLIEASSTSPADCPVLPERFATVKVDGWLDIGDNRASVESRLDNTAGRGNPHVLYTFSGFTPGNCPNGDLQAFDVTATMEISYRNDTVVRIKGSRLTTC